MATPERETLHREHEVCDREHQTWRETLLGWKQENQSLIATLHELEQLFVDHGRLIANHLAKIDEHQGAEATHEDLARQAPDDPAVWKWLHDAHDELMAAHRERQKQLERLGEDHDRALAMLGELRATLVREG